MREDIQMRNAMDVISSFTNALPLHMHLKNYFREHKNMGSKDRKILSALVFGYFRLKGKRTADFPEAMLIAGAKGTEFGNGFYAYWIAKKAKDEQLQNVLFEDYFPLAEHVSTEIDKDAFFISHFVQPKIWIRCKKGFENDVLSELRSRQYLFEQVKEGTIAFSKSYPLDQLETFTKGYFEIQDIASQKTIALLNPQKNESWWDCCAGAGGKSLLLLEAQPQIQLFISDNRESILNNLRERFNRSGIRNYNLFLADLTKKESLKRVPEFDCILADVPCSGSGTWGRSPEWLSFFKKEQLENYIRLQRLIVSNTVEKLKPGGKLIYITCSVYADENEKQIQWFLGNLNLELINATYLPYAQEGGDTMFGAVLKKAN